MRTICKCGHGRFWGLFCFVCIAVAFVPEPSASQALTSLEGLVTRAGAPIAGVAVTASGGNVVRTTRTDRAGRFRFAAAPIGTYVVSATADGERAVAKVELTSAGAVINLTLRPTRVIAAATAVFGARPPVRGSGTDLTLTESELVRSPASTTFPSLLLQLPGAARGANGVVHINGDHGDIDYIVDGVPIPQELNREVGSELDLSDAAFVEVLEGAYPAEYGDRFAAVLNVATRADVGAPSASGFAETGSYGSVNSTAEYHEPLGEGNVVLAFHEAQSDRQLDPPDDSSPHDRGSDGNQFLHLTYPLSPTDDLNLTAMHSYQTFQIPNDVNEGEPASTDDNETQDDAFATLQYRHAIGDHGSFSIDAAFKRSRIRDFGDPYNDFIFGERLNLENGGSAAGCADAVATGTFSPTTCGYSLFGNRTATDGVLLANYDLKSLNHDVRAGGSYDVTNVAKLYSVTLQPGNFLAPIFTPSTPDAAYAVTDNAPNVGHTETAYVQDAWRMGPLYELDYGLRYDAFQITSTQFHDAATQFSPRIKLTRFMGRRASVYLYYGRFFTPFSFENVSPEAAYLLNLPLQRRPAAFDLKPQRDSDYEVGGHLPLGPGDLGIRVMQKDATDLIDDTQVGVTALHQDINYQRGRIATQTIYYQAPLSLRGRFYLSANHTYSVNKGCETQLLAPCFGSPIDWTPADHEQRWGATAGIIANDLRGGWFSADGEYGSGLSSAACAPAVAVCKYTPHMVFDVEKGIGLRPGVALTMRIANVFNDRYYITYENAQGNHYSTGRAYYVGLRFNSTGP
jgi:hypothetical protein